jgi:hypothetical protein
MRGKSDLQESAAVAAIAEAPPHYHGHRKRLRARFRQAGAQGLAEYELLELVLFRALPRRDVKPIAKKLLEKFGSFAEVISAAAGAACGNLRARRGGEDRPGGRERIPAQRPAPEAGPLVLVGGARLLRRTRTRRSCACSFSTSATS